MRRSIQTVKPGATAKVIFDGNSLVAGAYSVSPNLPTAFASLVSPTTVVNIGISGQNWGDMNGTATDADGGWTSGSTNVLFLWETTNNVFSVGRSAANTIADANAYIAARRAAHPNWRIVMITTLPREAGPVLSTQADRDSLNATVNTVDDYYRKNYRAAGLDAIVDVRRPGSPFILPDYTSASFAIENGFWYEAPGSRVHLNSAGYQWVADRCYETFKRLRLR